MKGLEGDQKKLVYYSEFHSEPVTLLKHRDDVLVCGQGFLNQLKLVEGFWGEPMQERITIVNSGGNDTMIKNGHRLGGKRRT